MQNELSALMRLKIKWVWSIVLKENKHGGTKNKENHIDFNDPANLNNLRFYIIIFILIRQFSVNLSVLCASVFTNSRLLFCPTSNE